MKTESMKKTLPKLTGLVLFLFLCLILPLNFWLQLNLLHQSQMESTKEIFWQTEQLIQTTEESLQEEEQEFKQSCIRAADMVAFHIESVIEKISDLDYIRELAKKVNVDEIHFFSPDGEVFAGTHPQYYGYTFDSGEQIHFFSPMLKDKTLKMCQDIEPNTAEGKKMQYAAVWLEDGSCIVQIGMEPWHLQKKMEEQSLENLVNGMLFEMNGYLHILDKETNTIVASTSEKMVGMEPTDDYVIDGREEGEITLHHQRFQGSWYCVYTKEYNGYILVRTYKSLYLLQDILKSTLFVIGYVLMGGFGIVAFIQWYVEKKLIRSLYGIIEGLQKIETGNLDNIPMKTGIKEYEDLLFYINQMLNSIRLNRKHLTYILDKEEIPFGFFEKNFFYKQSHANNRMYEVLGIRKDMSQSAGEALALIEEKLTQAEKNGVSGEDHIYLFQREDGVRYLSIKKIMDVQGVIYYVIDVTAWWKNLNQVKRQSQRDELTGLFNRRGFYEWMNRLVETPDQLDRAALLMIDADGLKEINDIYGHLMGDQYLKRIAEVLQKRSGEKSVCARLGGDEFVAFLYGFSDAESLEDAILQIKAEREKRESFTESCVNSVQFSVGAAFYPEESADFHILMKIADERMYQEKKSRKK